jgi:hypothetical protein
MEWETKAVMVANSCHRDRFELGKAELRTHHDGSKVG